MKTKLIISGLAFMAITMVAGAQSNNAQNRQRNYAGKGAAYVDSNNNGICDNFGNPVSNAVSCKRPGNGKCCGIGQGRQGMGQGQGKRIYFVDTNKNGICDKNEIPVKK
jgi:hypothetical protein